LKIDISPYLTEISSDFQEILYTAANFELDERHVALVPIALVPNKKVALEFDRTYLLLFLLLSLDV